ncbi:hypothetical protein Pint_33979 [Pistacia integerrima]|uniref:Uncharacterized protein n=1 Tax=Pistacia integerrima TaxID=434235 RepID=A0ACC0X5Q1_9ROSI|nr:hypothetical protein Pint_33979 [Pistacia integerrima]
MVDLYGLHLDRTCTTVSWTFRIFYEKALLEYERQRLQDGEHSYRDVSLTEPSRIESQSCLVASRSTVLLGIAFLENVLGDTLLDTNYKEVGVDCVFRLVVDFEHSLLDELMGIEFWCFKYTVFKIIQEMELPVVLWAICSICGDCAGMLIIVSGWASWCFYRLLHMAVSCQALGSGRARRDAAARAMQGWHSKRLLGSGEVCQPIIKEKNSSSTPKSDRQIKNIGILKRKKPSSVERTVQVSTMKGANSQSDTMVIDIGPPADWVKINVQKTSDCFEVYALVPGLLREEVHVQSDPAGRLVISGQPEQLDNPWGVTPFKKVVSLPSRIDPHQTSAVVTLHGQLFVRVPFEQSDL